MKTNRDQYENYFKEHYNATFSAADTDMQSKFLFSQLLFIDKKINLSKYKNKKVLEIGSGLGAIANILLKEYEFEHYEGIELADKTHLFVLHPESWKVLLRKNNFKNIKAYPMSHLPYIWRINKRFNFRIPFYVAFRHFISTTMFIVS